jgi:CRISPR/Cas system CMR subunit Cmr6 (Cas7 group RAMP superfamily)
MRLEYENLIIQHNTNKMAINSKLSELQKIKDNLNSKNNQFEEDLRKNGDKYRQDVSHLTIIFNFIVNIHNFFEVN